MNKAKKVLLLLMLVATGITGVYFRSDLHSLIQTYPFGALLTVGFLLLAAVGVIWWSEIFPAADRSWQKLLSAPCPFLIGSALFLISVLIATVIVKSNWGAITSFVKDNQFAAILIAMISGMLIAWRFRLPSHWQEERDIVATISMLAGGLLFGLYLVAAAAGYAQEGEWNMVARSAIGWALGYFSAGFLVGFLFGIPRVLQGDGASPSPYQQRVNTNLEQISDWLTKIIVGLGLVQLRAVPEHLHNAAKWMAQSFSPSLRSPSEGAVSFAGAFIIFFCIVGFLAGYLATRLFLAGAFWRADRRQVPFDETDYSPTDKDIQERLREFWRPNGKENSASGDQLRVWLKQKGISGSTLAEFISDKNYAKLRKEATEDLKIPEIPTK